MRRDIQFLSIVAALIVTAPQVAAAATVVRTLPTGINGSSTFSFSNVTSADQLVSISGGTVNSPEGASLAIVVDYTNGSTAQILSQGFSHGETFNLSSLSPISFLSGNINGLTFTFSETGGSFVVPAGAAFTFRVPDPPPLPPLGGVPEPATWALMITGFGAVGSVMRLRRRGPHFGNA